MRNHIKIILALFSLALISLSCMENEDAIINALFDESGGSSNTTLPVQVALTFDTNQDGIVQWNELVGFDVYLQNHRNEYIYDISIQLSSFSDWGIISTYSSEIRSISQIAPGDWDKPGFYWCFSCGTASEVYVGNFYYRLGAGSGSRTLTVFLNISYYYNAQIFMQETSQTFQIR